ncbi:cyclin [Phycomyces blakesleeanus]|uniref:Cyclin n=2 Tax=Phycomyces blakesleeanus TaxID=4837 RepID=A0A167L1L5_PHYB8|nr:cyclin [Phycomyces blakesleeanus NRRL 1555(-)]OAD69386.1 cyclin [Phycomyces blakesleeanus NRRL 1555(-)]|eukprot:XP_018287426.1 cyclin [Phycomyces blakesleeanus NRRL 1555(-)]
MKLNIATFPVPLMANIVANLLESIVTANDLLPCTDITHFHSRAVPNINIRAYLLRILKFTPFTNEVFLSLLVYFDRISRIEKNFTVSSLNIHRLLITSIVVASKFTSDVFYPNARYAKVGGLPLCELNQLELEFLFLCNFELLVRLEDMQDYGNQLLAHAMTQPELQEEIHHYIIPSPTQSPILPPLVTRPDSALVTPAISSTVKPLVATYPLTPPTDATTEAPCPVDRSSLVARHQKHRSARSHPYAKPGVFTR